MAWIFFIDFLIKIIKESLKNRLGGTLGVPLERSSNLEPPKLDFYRFWTLLGTLLGAQVGSNFEPLARPGAS